MSDEEIARTENDRWRIVGKQIGKAIAAQQTPHRIACYCRSCMRRELAASNLGLRVAKILKERG